MNDNCRWQQFQAVNKKWMAIDIHFLFVLFKRIKPHLSLQPFCEWSLQP